MIELHLSEDVPGTVRFAFSPLAEVGSSLRLLADPHPSHPHVPWLAGVRVRFERARLPIELLMALAPVSRWSTAFLYPPATAARPGVERQLEVLGGLPVRTLRADLTRVWEGRRLPPVVTDLLSAGPHAAALLADALLAYWQVAIAPYWQRMCAVLEDDVAHRAATASAAGLPAVLQDLHPDVTVRADTLSVDKPSHDDAVYEGSRLTLVPSVFVWPRLVLTHTRPGSVELTYAARGVRRVWSGTEHHDPLDDHLGLLVGRTRACILVLVRVPMSTTQLARLLGQSTGSVHRHLAVLRDTGMVAARRSGRETLYRQTALGASVVAVDRASIPGRRRG